MSSGNQTIVACARVVWSQYPWSFLQGSLIPWYIIVSSFKSRVSCTFSSSNFQPKNIISWYPLFLVSALQFEELFIPICGIQFLSWRSYVNPPRAPRKGNLLSSLIWPWYFSSSAWWAESGKTWKFNSFLFVHLFDVIFSLLSSFLQSSGWGAIVFWCNFGRKIHGLICFSFRLKLVNNVLSFRKMLLWIYILLVL